MMHPRGLEVSPCGHKNCFMLNSTGPEMSTAHRNLNAEQ